MEKENTRTPYWVGVLVVLLVCSLSYNGYQYYATSDMVNDLFESIETCEDQGQVLRAWDSFDEIRVECFGELPKGDLHVYWE